MKYLIFTLIFSLVLGCSSSSKKESKYNLKYPKELQEVNQLIAVKKTGDARLRVEDYLNKAENIHWYGHAYFLQGFIYELEENYPMSIKFYRSAIEHGSNYESRVEAKALYNLSFVYERIDNRDDLLATLIDLMKRREFFDVLTGQVEIPARLAAAYASQGRLKEGMIFHREAAQNFTTLVRNQRFQAQRSELSKSLYYLGFVTFDQNEETFKGLIRKLSIGQKYFLASAEASKSTWSEKSVKRLQNQYTRSWSMIKNHRPDGLKNDPMAFKKQKQEGQLEMAAQLYDLMHKVRVEEFPMGQVNLQSKRIMDETASWLTRIENFTLTLSLGPEMIRNKKVKNTRLARYVKEEKKKVKVNKEKLTTPKETPVEPTGKPAAGGDIGKDPNL